MAVEGQDDKLMVSGDVDQASGLVLRYTHIMKIDVIPERVLGKGRVIVASVLW